MEETYKVFEYVEDIQGHPVKYLMTMGEKTGLNLRINNGLQFAERDEYRYHQMVFSLPFILAHGLSRKIRILVLGGGDGLGVKHINKLCDQYGVEKPDIDLVDISNFMLYISTHHHEMLRVNGGALLSSNVTLHNVNGVEYVKSYGEKVERCSEALYDLIVMDYPDPTVDPDSPVNYLFTKEHLSEVKKVLSSGGIVSSQSTSVIVSPNSFRYLSLNFSDSFETILQLRINIRTFGDIGVLIGADRQFELSPADLEGFSHLFFDYEDICVFQRILRDEMPDFPDEVIRNSDLAELLRYDLSKVEIF